MGRIIASQLADYDHAALDRPEDSPVKDKYTWNKPYKSTEEMDLKMHNAKKTLMATRRRVQSWRWRTTLQGKIDGIPKGSSAKRKGLVEERDYLDPNATMKEKAQDQKTWEEVNRTKAIKDAVAQQKEKNRVLVRLWDLHDTQLVRLVDSKAIKFFYWPVAHKTYDCQDLLPATWIRHTFMTRNTQMSEREICFVWLMEDNLIPTKKDMAEGVKVAGDDKRLRPMTCVPVDFVFCSIPAGYLPAGGTVKPLFCDWSEEKDSKDYSNQAKRFRDYKKALAKRAKMKVKDTSSKKKR